MPPSPNSSPNSQQRRSRMPSASPRNRPNSPVRSPVRSASPRNRPNPPAYSPVHSAYRYSRSRSASPKTRSSKEINAPGIFQRSLFQQLRNYFTPNEMNHAVDRLPLTPRRKIALRKFIDRHGVDTVVSTISLYMLAILLEQTRAIPALTPLFETLPGFTMLRQTVQGFIGAPSSTMHALAEGFPACEPLDEKQENEFGLLRFMSILSTWEGNGVSPRIRTEQLMFEKYAVERKAVPASWAYVLMNLASAQMNAANVSPARKADLADYIAFWTRAALPSLIRSPAWMTPEMTEAYNSLRDQIYAAFPNAIPEPGTVLMAAARRLGVSPHAIIEVCKLRFA